MKGLTVILALLVIALSVMPCCFDCEAEQDNIKTEQADNSEGSDSCSPFYSCSNCCISFAVFYAALPTSIPVLQTTSHFSIFTQLHFTSFQYSIWQPPKVI